VVVSGEAAAETTDHANAALVQEEKHLALANDMANLVMSMLRDQKKSQTERMDALQNGFASVMDIEWIAKFALGNNWRTATKEQRARYVKLYRSYLTKVYVENYTENSERKIRDIKVVDVNTASDDTFKVRTQVIFVSGEILKVDYLVRDLPNDNRILDVVIEGVSLLSSHRSEFAALATGRGVDAVISSLESKMEIKFSQAM
jgi:phospholipid transport system substrate-binding protein